MRRPSLIIIFLVLVLVAISALVYNRHHIKMTELKLDSLELDYKSRQDTIEARLKFMEERTAKVKNQRDSLLKKIENKKRPLNE